MARTGRLVRSLVLALCLTCLGGVVFSAPALAASTTTADGGISLWYATSLIAQVMLSIGAVGFVVQSARAYGGEIGKALYVAGGGVIVFAIWRLLDGATQILQLERPPGSVESAVYLVSTALLLAGFYMLYETMSSHATT